MYVVDVMVPYWSTGCVSISCPYNNCEKKIPLTIAPMGTVIKEVSCLKEYFVNDVEIP